MANPEQSKTSKLAIVRSFPDWLRLLALLSFFSCCMQPQMTSHRHARATENQTPPDRLPAAKKLKGIGNAHIDISANRQAQAWFDQGLNLLHDFWDYEAARAFQQSIRVDSRCAMCNWGLFQALSFYHGNAQGYAPQALAEANRLKSQVSEHERLYIEATTSKGDTIWRDLVRRYPNDPQAKIFLASAVSGREGIQLLRAVLRDHPNDSAANHYLIHRLEATDHPKEALPSAKVLARLAPRSGHMVHMPGHVFFVLGDYARAERAFRASTRVDEAYLRKQHVAPDDDWNYVHNLMYSIANLMEEGKLAKAAKLSARKLPGARGTLESTLYTYLARDSVSRIHPELPVALRTGDWPKVVNLLRASPPLEEWPNLRFLSGQLMTFASAMHGINAVDLAKAVRLSEQFDANLKDHQNEVPSSPPSADLAKLPQRHVLPDADLKPLLGTLSIMALELRASLLNAQGQRADAKRLFDEAAQKEKALGYREPPAYIRPVRETEGAAFLSTKDWAAATLAYEEAGRQRPHSGFPLYGLALCAENAGNLQEAVKRYQEFLAAWPDADRSSPRRKHAHAYLAAHQQRSTD